MDRKGTAVKVKGGLRRVAAWILGMGWLGVVIAGMAIAFSPSPHSPAIGWVLLGIAALILILTTDKWVKAFSALLACGIVGGIITIAEGHAVNNPQVRVARFSAIIMTLLIAASALVSFTFTKRKLHLPDRVALFVFCFFWGAAAPRLWLLTLVIGFSSLVVAWVFDRVHRRRVPERPSASTGAGGASMR